MSALDPEPRDVPGVHMSGAKIVHDGEDSCWPCKPGVHIFRATPASTPAADATTHRTGRQER